MYVKIVKEQEHRESQLFECDQVTFKKIIVDTNSEDDTHKRSIHLNTLYNPPANKTRYEAIIVTLIHGGDTKSFIAPESAMFILNNGGKTIDLLRCDLNVDQNKKG